jgi:TatD DNase family protein
MNTKLFAHLGLIDTHVHLDTISPVEPSIARAKAVGIKGIVAVGLNRLSNMRVLELAALFPEMVFPAIGYHPWFIVEDDMEEALGFIDENLNACTALGEVGLDYKVKVEKSVQIAVFKEVLDLARKHQKPVNIHCRYAFEKTLAMVLDAGGSKAVFHWYSGPLDILDKIIGSGFFISATPALSYSQPHRAAIERAPLSRILVETDAPEKYQGIVSEPATLIETIEHLSRIKNMPMAETAQITAANAASFYAIQKDENDFS